MRALAVSISIGLSGLLLTLPAGAQSKRACIPGAQVECACPGGTSGVQVCSDDGMRFERCQCDDAPARRRAKARPAPDSPEDFARRSDRRASAGWAMLALAGLTGITTVALGATNTGGLAAPLATGGSSLGFVVIGGPVAAAAGIKAREGLEAQGMSTSPPALRIAGWSAYGLSILTGAVTIGVAASSNDPNTRHQMSYVALIPITLGLSSIILFELDAMPDRKSLQNVIDTRPPAAAAVSNLGLGLIGDGRAWQLGLTGAW